jgi:tetratricopeptide (TPR) repeat protein
MLLIPGDRILFRGLPAAATVLLLALAGGPMTGCATTPAPGIAADATDGNAEAQAAPAPSPAAAKSADPLPKVYLSNELLFRLLLAEIAVQRSEPGPAFTEYMAVARQTRDPRLARRAAEVAINARALAQAMEAAELWRALAPNDTEAEQSYSSLLVANGRHEQARLMLQRQLALAPNPIEILDRLQRVLAHAPEPAQGLALLETLARPYFAAPATGFDAHLIVARGARVAGDNAAAIAHARAALAARPDSELAVMSVAQLLMESGTRPSSGDAPLDAVPAPPATAAGKDAGAAGHAEAMAMLGKFLTAHPAASEVRQAYARLLVGEGRLDEGRQQFEELLRRSPQSPDPLFALGVLALESEHYEDARGFLERYLAAVSSSGDRDLDLAYLNMARVAEGQRRFDEALGWLRKVKGPDQAEGAREREAFLLGRMNRVEEGLDLLRQMPSGTPEQRTQSVMAQGQLLRDAHRYEESYHLLDKALQDSPDDTGLLYESAMSAERLDRIDLMESRLRHLLQLRPDYAHAYNALGYSLADRNIRLQEAYQLIDHALTLAPDDGFIVDSMGWVQYRMGNLAAAREALTRAFQLKADPDVAAHLGEVLWASGDHSGARELLLNAQKRDGDSDTLRDTLQRLKIQP